MYKEERDIHRVFQIDTNRINSRSKLQAMNQLEKWFENGVIHIDESEVVLKEAMAGSDQLRSKKALSYVYSFPILSTSEDRDAYIKIQRILFPKGTKNSNQSNDVIIVYTAWRDMRILITNDGASKKQPGGILGHKDELKALGITVMSDIEAVDYVKNLILQRDQRAVEKSRKSGEPIPDWVWVD